MIERYFSQAKVLIRLRSGSVGPYLPRFVSALEQRRDRAIPFVAIFVERTVYAAGSTSKVSRWSKQIKVMSSDTCVSIRDCLTSILRRARVCADVRRGDLERDAMLHRTVF